MKEADHDHLYHYILYKCLKITVWVISYSHSSNKHTNHDDEMDGILRNAY